MNRVRRLFALSVFALALAGCATPVLQPAASPEDVGLSTAKLQEMSAAFRTRVDAGDIPGVVLLVAREGRIAWHEAIGWRDREAQQPMTRDAIFRIASMTKPVTALAVMMLVEDGKVRLDDPVGRHLPQLQGVSVGVEEAGGDGAPRLTLAARTREITVLDLLRHTSGITYNFTGKTRVKELYTAAQLMTPAQSNEEFVGKIAKLPLQMQPGTGWDYGMSYDVLARLVEVASGQGFEAFVRDRILGPLRMQDTGFWVDADRHARLAEPQVLRTTGQRPPMWPVKQKPQWFSGGHGLASTAADYARLCQMFLEGGSLDGVRLVSADTVALMRSNHLTPATPVPAGWGALGPTAPTEDNGQGYGLGFAVRVSEGKNRLPGSIGDFSWAGASGTYFWIDPKERLVAVLMLQAPSPGNVAYRTLLRQHVYAALGRP